MPLELISPIGGDLIYWKSQAPAIKEFIRANQLKAARIGALVQPGAEMMGAAPRPIFDINIRGGMPVAHLHYGSKIYLLNDAQWAEFSGRIIADAKAMLAKTKQIGFDQAMVLGNATQNLAR